MPYVKNLHLELTGGATSETTFGRSEESQRQIADASSPNPPIGKELNIYRLEPAAVADDRSSDYRGMVRCQRPSAMQEMIGDLHQRTNAIWQDH